MAPKLYLFVVCVTVYLDDSGMVAFVCGPPRHIGMAYHHLSLALVVTIDQRCEGRSKLIPRCVSEPKPVVNVLVRRFNVVGDSIGMPVACAANVQEGSM